MGVGKYSPTVSTSYRIDQKWWEKNGGGEVDPNYDKDGFDSYGYDKDGKDRAGYTEWDYLGSGEWIDDEYCYPLAEEIYNRWNINLLDYDPLSMK